MGTYVIGLLTGLALLAALVLLLFMPGVWVLALLALALAVIAVVEWALGRGVKAAVDTAAPADERRHEFREDDVRDDDRRRAL